MNIESNLEPNISQDLNIAPHTSLVDQKPNLDSAQQKPPVVESSIDTNISEMTENIVSHLQNLVTSANKSIITVNPRQIKSSIDFSVLIRVLNHDTDIRERLTDIIKGSNFSSQRQLQDMQLYLNLLCSHAEIGDKEQLYSLVNKIKEVSNLFLQSESPRWTTEVEKLEKKIQEILSLEKPLSSVIPVASLLDTHMKTPVDGKIFAHINAEVVIGGTEYEGGSSLSMISYLKKYLETNQNTYHQIPEVKSLIKMLSDAEKFSIAASMNKGVKQGSQSFRNDFLARCESFQTIFIQIVQNLKPGEKTLVDTGWVDHKGGHSMKLSIERENEGTFRLLLYNTGVGLKTNHFSLWDNGELLYQPFIELKGVKQQKLLDSQYIQALLEINLLVSHPDDSRGATNYDSKDIYGIFKAFGGEVIQSSEREKFIPPQQTGVCTWASLLAVLHTNLSIQDYYKISNDIILDSICAYYQKVKDNLSGNEESRLLLEHSAIKCAQNTLEAYQNNAITVERLQKINATLKELQSILERAEGDYRETKSPQENLVFEYLKPLIPHSYYVKNWTLNPNIPNNSVFDLTPISPSIHDSNSFDWIDNPANIKDGVHQLQETIRSCINKGNRKEGIGYLELFFKLQSRPGKIDIWDQIPIADISEVIVDLANLGKHLFDVQLLYPHRLRTLTTNAYYLNALILILAKRIPELQLDKSGIEYKSYYNSVVASLRGGSLVKDQNLYSPEERFLREQTLKILGNQETEGYHFNFDSSVDSFGVTKDKVGLPDISDDQDYKQYELNFIDQYLKKNPSKIDLLIQRYPRYKKELESRSYKVALAFCDWNGDILPPAFCAMRRQALIASSLCQERVLKTNETWHVKSDIEINNNQEILIRLATPLMKTASTIFRDFKLPHRFNELIEIRKSQNLTKKLEAFSDRIYDSEADVMQIPNNDWQRHLQLILTQGDINNQEQYLEQQVIKTLSYFSKHIELLTDSDTRILCRFLIFEDHYLEKILEKNSSFGSLLFQFVERGYQQFSERENIAGATFFIELGRNLDQLLRFNHQELDFPDTRKRVTDILKGTSNQEERTLMYLQLAASYNSDPPETLMIEDTTQLLTAFLHIKIFPLLEYKGSDYLYDEVEKAAQRWQGDIQKQLQSNEGKDICNAILSTFAPKAIPQEWNCTDSYPLCISQDRKYVLNASSLEFFIDNQSLTGLPLNILNEPDFYKIFSGKNYPCHLLNQSCYEFTDDTGCLTQVAYINSQFKIRQKLEDGNWYQLSSRWDVWSFGTDFGKLPQDFIEICEKNSLWISVDSKVPRQVFLRDHSLQITHLIKLKSPQIVLTREQQESVSIFLRDVDDKKNAFLREPMISNRPILKILLENYLMDLPLENRMVIWKQIFPKKSSSFEFSLAEEPSEIETFLSQPPATPLMEILQNLYRSLFNEDKNQLVIDVCIKKNPKGEGFLDLMDLHNIPNTTFETLFKNGMLWRDNQGMLQELELPSLDLLFDMRLHDRTWKAYSAEYPGFFVASNQHYRGLQAIEGGIVLENDRGKRKLILPYGIVEPLAKGPFKTNLKIRRDITKPSISFDLDNVSRPITVHKEQQLYLANILLVQKKYVQAQQLLRSSYSHVLPYTNQEKMLLEQIRSVALNAEDNSPHAKAIIFTSLALLPSTNLSQMTTHEVEDLSKKYIQLKEQRSVIPHLILSRDEERSALSTLIKILEPLEDSVDRITLLVFLKSSLNALDFQRHTQEVILPSSKEAPKKKVFEFSFMQKFGSSEISLITRPHKPDLLDWFELARKDPLKLELFLVGAEREASISDELINFFRGVGHGYFVDRKMLIEIINDKDDKKFSALINEAGKFERKWQKEHQKSQLSDITLSGDSVKRLPHLKEQQTIGIRPSIIPPLSIDTLPKLGPILSKNQLGSFKEIDNQGLFLSTEDILSLKKAVYAGKEKHSSEAKDLAEYIEKYWTLEKHQGKWHRLEPEKLHQTKTTLLVNSAQMGKKVNLYQQELLAFANELPSDGQKAILFETEKMGQMRQEITIRDLMLFAARSRHFTLSGKNSKTDEQEKELLNKCLDFLHIKAQQMQLNRAITILGELEKTNIDTQAYNQLSENVYKELTRKRPYDADMYPELLVFEVIEDIGLHDWQVQDLERMLAPKTNENPNIILEKVMGSGKTKVYLPLLALSKANGENLSMIIVHSSQFETVASAMQIKSGQMFDQIAHTLPFSRDSDTSIHALQHILDECEKVRRQRQFFVVTDKSMHSLGLAFDELWDSYLSRKEENTELEARIELMKQILSLIKNNGKATFDEADLLLNCRYEVVYSLGDPTPIAADHANIVADLYRSIESGLARLHPFTLQNYEKIKPELIEAFIKEVVAKEMANVDHNMVFDYLKGNKKGAEYVTTLPSKQRNLLAIALHEFKELLPIVLDKRCGEHYGYSNNPDKILPVPYVASGVPSATSEFSFPYALLDYTMQTLKQEGVAAPLLKQLIQNMQYRAEKELKANSMLELKNTQGYKDFLELCGETVSIPFLRIRDSDIEKIVDAYKKLPTLIYSFAKKYLFSSVTLHNRKLTSTPYTLFNMFQEVQGFTGTPWNSKTYPKALTTKRDINSAGKTQGIIWRNSQKVHDLNSVGINDVIDEIANLQQMGDYHAFIDVGALFNGVGNETVAKAILKQLPDTFQGILFYKDNRPFVLKRNRSEPIPYEKFGTTQSLYIFYDQWHTTGTDFKINGKSLLSIGKNTKMRDLEQGYMRDRQAELGERVEFILSPETISFLKSELKLAPEAKISTAEILQGTEVTQERELKEQLLMGAFGRIKETVHFHLRTMQQTIPPAKFQEKSELIRQLIGDLVTDAPWEQFGRYQEDISLEIFFESIITQTLETMQPLMDMDPSLTRTVLEKELWGSIDVDLLPKMICATAKFAPEQLVEQQSQTQLQQERMSMVQKELMSDLETTGHSGPIHWNWKSNKKVSMRSYYEIRTPNSLKPQELPVMSKEGRIWIPHSDGQPPFLEISEIFSELSPYKKFSDIFDIQTSYNFLPVRANIRRNLDMIEVRKSPFDKGQLEVQNLLICRDKNTGEIQLRLISQADAGFFFNKLDEERAELNEHEIDVTLYHMTLGIIQNNSTVNLEENILDPAVRKKIIQAKFFNGESLYTTVEKVLLKDWINEKGIARMEELFSLIIAKKEEKYKEFPGSTLQTLFTQIRKLTMR